MMMVPIITMPSVPIVRAVIRSVIGVRIIVPIGVVSVIARTEPDTKVNLSIRTRRSRNHQAPGHDCNQQKSPHNLPPRNLTKKSVESFPVIRSAEHLDML